MDDGPHMHFVGRHERKSLGQVKTHLITEHTFRASACTVRLFCAIVQNMLKQIEIGFHQTFSNLITVPGKKVKVRIVVF